jgi:hypothetical protein
VLEKPLTIFILIVGLGAVACYVLVLVKLFRVEGNGKGVLGLLFGPYVLFWGWVNSKRLSMRAIMLTWSVLLLLFYALPAWYFFLPKTATVKRAEETVIAEIGKDEITVSEFRRRKQQLVARYRAMGADPATSRQLDIAANQALLDALITERLIKAEAERLGLTVEESEIDAEIKRMPGFSDPQLVERELAASGLTMGELQSDTRFLLLSNKLRAETTFTVQVSEAELDQELQKLKASAAERENVRRRLLDEHRSEMFDKYVKATRNRYEEEGKLKIHRDRLEAFLSNNSSE